MELITHPQQFPRVLETAMNTAVRERGVAMIVLPGDIALKPAPSKATVRWTSSPQPAVIPAESDLNRLGRLLESSEAITMLCGSGCAGAHDEIVTVADLLAAPIVHALRGKEHIEWDNPFDVGMTGLIGFSSGYHAMLNCDTLLMLGTDFPYRNFYPTKAKIVQVDISRKRSAGVRLSTLGWLETSKPPFRQSARGCSRKQIGDS